MYNRSNHTFFVGNQHKHLDLKLGKWSVIQNGVEKSIIERFSSHQINTEGKMQFCVLANLMPHHRFDILSEALHSLTVEDRSKFTLHLIGFNFEPVLPAIPEGVEYIYYGPKEKEEIYALLSRMHVAVISGGPQYSSFMKLYDYAAVKLAVICPVLENIISNFSEDEIVYFRNEDAADLARVIKKLVDEPSLAKVFGNRLFEKVKNNFTWETIFEGIANTITSQISLFADKTTRTQLNINAE
ncbi:MAG TPA: glycosyltransferase, partial [Parasegetibacter sp.]